MDNCINTHWKMIIRPLKKKVYLIGDTSLLSVFKQITAYLKESNPSISGRFYTL
jgi:hypothetical protein